MAAHCAVCGTSCAKEYIVQLPCADCVCLQCNSKTYKDKPAIGMSSKLKGFPCPNCKLFISLKDVFLGVYSRRGFYDPLELINRNLSITEYDKDKTNKASEHHPLILVTDFRRENYRIQDTSYKDHVQKTRYSGPEMYRDLGGNSGTNIGRYIGEKYKNKYEGEGHEEKLDRQSVVSTPESKVQERDSGFLSYMAAEEGKETVILHQEPVMDHHPAILEDALSRPTVYTDLLAMDEESVTADMFSHLMDVFVNICVSDWTESYAMLRVGTKLKQSATTNSTGTNNYSMWREVFTDFQSHVKFAYAFSVVTEKLLFLSNTTQNLMTEDSKTSVKVELTELVIQEFVKKFVSFIASRKTLKKSEIPTDIDSLIFTDISPLLAEFGKAVRKIYWILQDRIFQEHTKGSQSSLSLTSSTKSHHRDWHVYIINEVVSTCLKKPQTNLSSSLTEVVSFLRPIMFALYSQRYGEYNSNIRLYKNGTGETINRFL